MLTPTLKNINEKHHHGRIIDNNDKNCHIVSGFV